MLTRCLQNEASTSSPLLDTVSRVIELRQLLLLLMILSVIIDLVRQKGAETWRGNRTCQPLLHLLLDPVVSEQQFLHVRREATVAQPHFRRWWTPGLDVRQEVLASSVATRVYRRRRLGIKRH